MKHPPPPIHQWSIRGKGSTGWTRLLYKRSMHLNVWTPFSLELGPPGSTTDWPQKGVPKYQICVFVCWACLLFGFLVLSLNMFEYEFLFILGKRGQLWLPLFIKLIMVSTLGYTNPFNFSLTLTTQFRPSYIDNSQYTRIIMYFLFVIRKHETVNLDLLIHISTWN